MLLLTLGGVDLGRLFLSHFTSEAQARELERTHPFGAESRAYYEGAESSPCVPVLLYHGIEDEPGKVKPSEFCDQMLALKRAGYSTISVAQMSAFLASGAPLPLDPVLITFDDGLKSSYYPVEPVLKATGYRATMFVIVDDADRHLRGYLSWPEIRVMAMSGHWDIEAHAYVGHATITADAAGRQGHFFGSLRWLWDQQRRETAAEYTERVGKDLDVAKSRLAFGAGAPIDAFAVPYGDDGQDDLDGEAVTSLLRAAMAQRFKVAFRVQDGEPRPVVRGMSPVALPRIELAPGTSGDELIEKLARASGRTAPAVGGGAKVRLHERIGRLAK
jgi:peptidoglycan/xylan/chitin deacetylase (PgdA/CDA1 family)